MPRVLHVIDRTCHETHAQLIETLVGRLGGKNCDHLVVAIDADARLRLQPYISGTIDLAPQRLARVFNLAPGLRKIARSHESEILHVWGPDALRVAAAAMPKTPHLLTLLDPRLAKDLAKQAQALTRIPGVITGSQLVRTILVEAGFDPQRNVVVRAPADFGAINRARDTELRQKLIGDAGPVLLIDGPPTRGGGQFEAVWAAAIVRQTYPDIRVVLPYISAERARVHRYAVRMTSPDFCILPEPGWTWSELVTTADVFLMTPSNEVGTESLAAAMAAGVPCVATAVRSIAEVIADRHNGLLCRDNSLQTLSGRLLTALEDKTLIRNITDVARSQAFEVFGVRAFADNYQRAYENLISGNKLGDGVEDTAMVA